MTRLFLVCMVVIALQVAAPAPLTVMSFNIRFGTANDGPDRWELRRGQLIDLLKAQNPDVIGVQEALHFQIDEILTALPDYRMVGVGRSDGGQGGEYAAILYRASRLSVRRTSTFWLSDTPEVVKSNTWGAALERICTWALFDDKEGTPFYLFNLHLEQQADAPQVRGREPGLALEGVVRPGRPDQRPDERELVRDLRDLRHQLRDAQAGQARRDRPKLSADLLGGVRLRVDGVVLRRAAVEVDVDDRLDGRANA